MRRFIVEQEGTVLLEATRQFVVEVPDHFTDKQTEELLQCTSLPDDEGIDWIDELHREWAGYDVEINTTCAYGPDTSCVMEAGLKVIHLEDAK